MKQTKLEVKVQKAVLQSINAIDVFTRTVQQLTDANQSLAEARAEYSEKIHELEQNMLRIHHQEERNNKHIDKINQIIGGE